MGRKNPRRTKRSNASVISSNTDVNDDVVQQLRQQRLAAMRSGAASATIAVGGDAQSENDDWREPMGGYIYDPVKKSYFPKQYMKEQQQQQQQNLSSRNQSQLDCGARHRSYPHYPMGGFSTNEHSSIYHRPALLSYASQLCHESLQRRRFVSRWAGQLRLESMHQHRRCKAMMPNHPIANRLTYAGSSPQDGGVAVRSIVAETATSNVPPWIRTFDVLPHFDTGEVPVITVWPYFCLGFADVPTYGYHIKVLSPHTATKSPTSNGEEEIPQIGVLLQEDAKSTFILNRNRQLGFRSFKHPHAVNDFTRIGYQKSSIILAGNTESWFHYDYVANREQRQRFEMKQSEILCVEAQYSSTTPSSGDVFFCGHRNGGISMHDIRDRCSTTIMGTSMQTSNNKKLPDAFGNVVAMQLLFDERPYQLLVRGTNGAHCRLFDIRRCGRKSNFSRYGGSKVASSSSSSSKFSSCMIHELDLPHELNNRNPCIPSKFGAVPTKGFVTDPHRTCVIVPYIDYCHERANFGLWSLDTGEYIGSKPVLMDDFTPNPGDCLEVCSKVTCAKMFGENDPKSKESSTTNGSFGFFFRWGGSKFHHVAMEGRRDPYRSI